MCVYVCGVVDVLVDVLVGVLVGVVVGVVVLMTPFTSMCVGHLGGPSHPPATSPPLHL